MSDTDWAAVRVTLELASLTTVLLLLIGTPLSWWLSQPGGRWQIVKTVLGTVVTLPLILPPAVLGFYLLVLMGPHGPIGQFTQAIGLGLLPFTFPGLVLASVIYSMPFVVQPLQQAFSGIGALPLQAAATLRASPWDTFWSVTLPLARPGFLTAAVLGFAHTVGEFGVVLMIGGNIPGKTQVLSMAIYNHVEAMEYPEAHRLAAGLLVFSFAVLLLLYRRGWGRSA